MFEVYLGREAEKALAGLSGKLAIRVKEALRTLKTTPIPVRTHDLKKISGTDNVYRIRVSDHRTIYAVYWDRKEINVLRIARRDDRTYRRL